MFRRRWLCDNDIQICERRSPDGNDTGKLQRGPPYDDVIQNVKRLALSVNNIRIFQGRPPHDDDMWILLM